MGRIHLHFYKIEGYRGGMKIKREIMSRLCKGIRRGWINGEEDREGLLLLS